MIYQFATTNVHLFVSMLGIMGLVRLFYYRFGYEYHSDRNISTAYMSSDPYVTHHLFAGK